MKNIASCFALYALSLAVCMGIFYITRYPLTLEKLEWDEKEYWDMGGDIVAGRYEPDMRRPIGYPATMAALRWLCGDRVLGVQIGLSAFFCLSAPLLFLLVRRNLGTVRPAWVAGLTLACWPPAARYGATLYSEPLALPCLMATLLALPAPGARAPCRRWLLAGLMLGVSIHIRAAYLLYAPLLALVVVMGTRGMRRGAFRVLLVAFGSLIAIVPWSFVLSRHVGSFMFFPSTGGETFAGGLNPVLLERGEQAPVITPDGRQTWSGPGKWLPPHDNGYLSEEELNLPYREQDRLMWQRSLRWVAANPEPALHLTMRKLLYMGGFYPFWNGTSQTLLGNVPTMVLLILGLLSLITFRRHVRQLSPFWTLPLFAAVIAMIGWGSWRFRQPADVGMIVLAAALTDIQGVKTHLANMWNNAVAK